MLKLLLFIILGGTLVLGNPISNVESVKKRRARAITEVDETANKNSVILIKPIESDQENDIENKPALEGFSIAPPSPPTPEPPVGEEILSEELTELPVGQKFSVSTQSSTVNEENKFENSHKFPSISEQVDMLMKGIEERLKKHFEVKRIFVDNAMDSVKKVLKRWL